MKKDSFVFFFTGVLLVAIIAGCSGKIKEKPGIPWADYFKQAEERVKEDAEAKYIQNTKFWVTVKPDDNLNMKTVISKMGDPKETEKVTLHREAGRPEILKLHKYNGLIFVESDWSATPGMVTKILIRRN